MKFDETLLLAALGILTTLVFLIVLDIEHGPYYGNQRTAYEIRSE